MNDVLVRGKLTENLVLSLKLGPDLKYKVHRLFQVNFKNRIPKQHIHIHIHTHQEKSKQFMSYARDRVANPTLTLQYLCLSLCLEVVGEHLHSIHSALCGNIRSLTRNT